MEVDLIAARAAARLAKQVEKALAGVDLTVSQYRVLGVLAEESAVAGLVASRLAVRPPSLTTVIDGLVSRHLVERETDPDDRRRQVLVLTERGHEALAASDRAVAARLRALADHLDGRAADSAMAGLARWNDVLDRVRDERAAVVRR